MKKFLLTIAIVLAATLALADGPTDFSGVAATTPGTSFVVNDLTKHAPQTSVYVSCVDAAISFVAHAYDPRSGVWSVVYPAGYVSLADSVVSAPANMIVPMEGRFHGLLITAASSATVYVHKYRD